MQCIIISAVKISSLIEAIKFFSLTLSNYLTPLTQGEDRVGQPTLAATSVSFL